MPHAERSVSLSDMGVNHLASPIIVDETAKILKNIKKVIFIWMYPFTNGRA